MVALNLPVRQEGGGKTADAGAVSSLANRAGGLSQRHGAKLARAIWRRDEDARELVNEAPATNGSTTNRDRRLCKVGHVRPC